MSKLAFLPTDEYSVGDSQVIIRFSGIYTDTLVQINCSVALPCDLVYYGSITTPDATPQDSIENAFGDMDHDLKQQCVEIAKGVRIAKSDL